MLTLASNDARLPPLTYSYTKHSSGPSAQCPRRRTMLGWFHLICHRFPDLENHLLHSVIIPCQCHQLSWKLTSVELDLRIFDTFWLHIKQINSSSLEYSSQTNSGTYLFKFLNGYLLSFATSKWHIGMEYNPKASCSNLVSSIYHWV